VKKSQGGHRCFNTWQTMDCRFGLFVLLPMFKQSSALSVLDSLAQAQKLTRRLELHFTFCVLSGSFARL